MRWTDETRIFPQPLRKYVKNARFSLTRAPLTLAPSPPFTAGIYTAVGLNVSWLNINVAGDRKRATAIGIQQLMGESFAPPISRFLSRPKSDLRTLSRSKATLVESSRARL